MGFTDYIQYRIKVSTNGMEIALEELQEIVLSELTDMPFESFETTEDCILAYVQAGVDEPSLRSMIESIKGVGSVEKSLIKGENWNKIWEESFEPITIGSDVIIRAPFHRVDKKYRFEIIIEPKMSFGTGHHSTTRLMMENMLHLTIQNKSVLDMGCGTGILAILAHKLGASRVTAADNDPQCVENSIENVGLNHCEDIAVCMNDKILANFKTDIVLANIQKNVLTEQMPLYKQWLNPKGTLLVSGIFEEAVADVTMAAQKNGLQFVDKKQLNDWCLLQFANEE